MSETVRRMTDLEIKAWQIAAEQFEKTFPRDKWFDQNFAIKQAWFEMAKRDLEREEARKQRKKSE